MNIQIGKRIESMRKEKGFTLKELGDKIGVASSTILRYEKGEITTIKLPVIESIAKALEVDPAWLVLKSEKPTPVRVEKSETKKIPILGSIAAGTPTLAEENIEDYFNIDSRINADFALRVQGDSMIDAGILEGDIVFIQQTSDLENGTIGAILVDGEATLKKFYRTSTSIILQSQNDKYSPMVFTGGDIKILGRLSAVLNISK